MDIETLPIAEALGFESTTSTALSGLMARACVKRRAQWGETITYSRKVFVPLTNMCRDTCTYCSFVKTPDDPAANYMTPDQVLETARQGEATGCKELLFSLGERPELRYPEAAAALENLGYATTNEYLRAMCELVLAKTTLLPHVNAGTLTDAEIDMLKPVSASMGMMLETVSRRLTRKGMPHHACPDKTPVQRLRTLERAGERGVPFTTGLLIGIGETWAERVESLAAINAAHARHGHIQEVIIQNFQQKRGIVMESHPEPSLEDMLRTLAVARLMLAPEISLQAPPNLSVRHAEYLKAGMNDWGGISPVTVDFINPDHAWPQIDELAGATAKAGLTLQERLTIYPNFLKQSDRFLDPSLTARLADMARPDGLARVQCLGAAS
jgi:FO synthase